MRLLLSVVLLSLLPLNLFAVERDGEAFFERRIRPILAQHCFECHSEAAQEQQGGLLLDRQSGWLEGGTTGKVLIPGQPDVSLLIKAVRYDEDLQMPPDGPLSEEEIELLQRWVEQGAPGPRDDLGQTEFSRLGDQEFLSKRAQDHWAFQEARRVDVPDPAEPTTESVPELQPVDLFIARRLQAAGLQLSEQAERRTLVRRMCYDLTGLPPARDVVARFVSQPGDLTELREQLLHSTAFGEHLARMWLDVARYADTDSFYRPDTRTPHYFPYAFTYRDYVIASFNQDKAYDQFIREQLAADLMFDPDRPEIAALGFLTVGPHANRNPTEAIDDWIDLTTRGLLGITAACARCHDHKYEPIPTADYYSLHGVFASVQRVNPLDEKQQPLVSGYAPSPAEIADYEAERAKIDRKIREAGGKKAKANKRSIARKIRETELAKLLLFHRGAPARAMVVVDRKRPVEPVIYLRGDPTSRGDRVPRRFLKALDPAQPAFSAGSSGRLELADKILDPRIPLASRVYTNRVWGYLMGSHLVATSSDFGLQGSPPSHPDLLEWLSNEFIRHDWSTKWLVRTIVSSRTYRQSSAHRADAAGVDPENRLLWRSNRRRLSVESLRDSYLAISGKLDRRAYGRPEPLWGDDYTHRRTVYGYINRFNLDPTLRVFDFPSPMQSQPARVESIVAPQALFTLNSRFVIDQAEAVTQQPSFKQLDSDDARIDWLFSTVLQRSPHRDERVAFTRSVDRLQSRGEAREHAWTLVAQSLLMTNEFQYVD